MRNLKKSFSVNTIRKIDMQRMVVYVMRANLQMALGRDTKDHILIVYLDYKQFRDWKDLVNSDIS